MFGISELSFNFLTGKPFVTALFFLFFVLLAVYLYRQTNPPLPRGLRIFLTALRIVAVLALFLALFEPVLSYKREFDRKPRLTLFIDNSRSMEINENGRSRKEEVDSLLSSNAFKKFADAFDVTKKSFADGLIKDNKSLDVEKTSIGDAITQLSEQEIALPAEYWFLLSDGISNSGISPLVAAEAVKTPVFTIGVGKEASEKDIAISGIDHNQVVFAGKPTEMTVHLQWSGMNNDTAHIEILSRDRILETKAIRLPAGALKQDEKISFSPERPGQQTFQVKIPDINGEVQTDNNSRSFSMTVLKSKLKVLLAADRLDWEFAFLNRLLSNSANIELTPVISKKEGEYLGDAFPARQEELNQYDMIILYDVDIPRLKSKSELFKSFLLDRGGGIFAILGENYLKSGFPRWLDDYLPFVSTDKRARIYYNRFTGKPVENYLFHPAVRLSDNRQGIREGWNSMPPFEAIVPTDSIMPGSEILVGSGINTTGSDLPVLGFRSFGAGKALASTAAPFWHWLFYDYGFGGEGKEYHSFFEGIVNWLALREESDPIKISPDKTIYTKGEKVGFSASVYDLSFRPIGGATGNITLINQTGADTTITQLMEKSEGQYRAEFETLPPGKYKFIASINKDGKKLRESSGEIAIEAFSIEDYRRRPDFGALASISQLTGGAFSPLNEIDSLYSKMKNDKIVVSIQKEIVLWNKFWLLAIFILALAAEWFLRKKYQLI